MARGLEPERARTREGDPSSSGVIRFGPFELDLDASELRSNGEAVEIRRTAFRLLVVLADHPDRFVSKAELLRLVWPDSTVSEASVYSTLRDLRRTLSESGDGADLIETRRGRGYRLAASVRPIASTGRSVAEIEVRCREAFGAAHAEIVARRIAARTGGHPRLVDALIERLVRESASGWEAAFLAESATLPTAFFDDTSDRWRALPADVQQVLEAAATQGRVFEPAIVARLAGRSVAAVEPVLDRAAALGWIEVDPSHPRKRRFVEPEAAELSKSILSPSRRAALHSAAADMLDAPDATVDALRLVALHALQSSADPRTTVARCRRAAAALDRADRSREALVLRRAALAIADSLDHDERFRLLDETGQAHFAIGEPDAARAIFGQALDLARARNAWERFADAALGYSGALIDMDTAVPSPRHVAILEEALDHAAELPDIVEAALRARLALEKSWTARFDEARHLADAAIASLRAVEEPHVLGARIAHDVYWSSWTPDNTEERIRLAVEMRNRAEGTGQAVLAAMASALHAAAVLERGDRLEAEASFPSNAELLARDHAAIALLDTGRRACIALLEGRFDDAERLASEASETARRSGSANAALIHAAQMGWLRFDQGRLAELAGVDALLGGVLERPRHEQRAGRAMVLAYADRATEAREELEALVARLDRIPRDAFWLPTLAMLVELAAKLNDGDAAAALYPALRPYAERAVMLGIRTVCRGSVELYLGLAARLFDRGERALGHFDRAVRANARLRAAPLLARSLLLLAATHRALDRPGSADAARAAEAEGQRIRIQLGLPLDTPI